MNGDTPHAVIADIPQPRQGQNTNGDGHYNVSRIVEALQAVHGSQATNETRRQASLFLEEAKAHDEAPFHGFSLASDQSQPPVVRHFALSLLEHGIRYRWVDYSDEQARTLRQWVTTLAEKLDDQDPAYLRNKVAQLWVDLAKRSWADHWLDMDEQLVQLWRNPEGGTTRLIFVAEVLEGLSDDVFHHEDAAVSIRGSDLSKACVDIFTPAVVLQEHFPNRSHSVAVRCGDEGWLSRLVDFLIAWSGHPSQADQASVAIKVISALKAALGWSIPKAIVTARCVPGVCRCLSLPNPQVQMVSRETSRTGSPCTLS
jgi:exportin-5